MTFFPFDKTKGEDGSAGDGNSSPTLDPIEIGETLPSFVLKNEKDEDVDVATLAREKGVVFFLVPKADTRKQLECDPLSAPSLIT